MKLCYRKGILGLLMLLVFVFTKGIPYFAKPLTAMQTFPLEDQVSCILICCFLNVFSRNFTVYLLER